MSPQAFHDACMALPAATMTVQWGDDQVYKVGGKMFAVAGPGAGKGGFSFKASDLAFEVLTENGMAKPAPYLARAKWVWFESLEGLDEAKVADWLKTAHALVAAKLTKAARKDLGLL